MTEQADKTMMDKAMTINPDEAFDEKPSVAPVRHHYKSVDLLGTAKEIVIEHRGEAYRLRLTSQGKLILTK